MSVFRLTFRLSLSLKELEQKAKNRSIKDYKTLSIDKLFSMLDKLQHVKKLLEI